MDRKKHAMKLRPRPRTLRVYYDLALRRRAIMIYWGLDKKKKKKKKEEKKEKKKKEKKKKEMKKKEVELVEEEKKEVEVVEEVVEEEEQPPRRFLWPRGIEVRRRADRKKR